MNNSNIHIPIQTNNLHVKRRSMARPQAHGVSDLPSTNYAGLAFLFTARNAISIRQRTCTGHRVPTIPKPVAKGFMSCSPVRVLQTYVSARAEGRTVSNSHEPTPHSTSNPPSPSTLSTALEITDSAKQLVAENYGHGSSSSSSPGSLATRLSARGKFTPDLELQALDASEGVTEC